MMGSALHRIEKLNGWRAMLACFISGAITALAFAPLNFWPLIFLTLPIFYILLDNAMNLRRAMLRSLMFGYGYFMMGTWWIANSMLVDIAKFGWMIPFSILGLSGAMALYFLLFGMAMHKLRSPVLWKNILRFVALWVAMEYLRSAGIFGFPWNLMGYVTLSALPVAQLGSVVGTFGLSFIVVLAGVLPVLYLRGQTANARLNALFLPVILVAALYCYGHGRLQNLPVLSPTTVKIVQPNIAQAVKNSRGGRAIELQTLGELSSSHGGPKPDVTVWPESAYPFSLRDTRADMYPPSGLLITGAVRVEGEARPDLKIFNSIAAIDSKGVVRATYDKAQLVPFGEFVPLRSVLPLEKITPGDLDFTRGQGPTTIAIDDVPPFSPLVCYEVVFPWLSADPSHRPAWLVNATNDGWYGDSPGPYQHFAMARMRAIEQGLPLVRAANSGISGLVDPYGRVVAMLPLDVRGELNVTLPQSLPPTLYAKTGEWLTLLIIVFVYLFSYLPIPARKK